MDIKKISIITLSSIVGLAAIGGIGFGVYQWNESRSLETCDSAFTQEQVLKAYKESSKKYKDFEKDGAVENVEITTTNTSNFDEKNRKYTCSANLKIKGTPKGLYSGGDSMNRWRSANTKFDYTVSRLKGKNIIEITSDTDSKLYYDSFILPTCDSAFATEKVARIFKQNSQIYSYQSSVGQVLGVTVTNPRVDYYDKDSNKYSCVATVDLHLTGNKSMGITNYYTRASYDIVRSNGTPKVFASFRGGGRLGIY